MLLLREWKRFNDVALEVNISLEVNKIILPGVHAVLSKLFWCFFGSFMALVIFTKPSGASVTCFCENVIRNLLGVVKLWKHVDFLRLCCVIIRKN